ADDGVEGGHGLAEAQRAVEGTVEPDRVAAQVAEQGEFGLALGGDDGAGAGVGEVEGGGLGGGLRGRSSVGGRLRGGRRFGLLFAAHVLSPPSTTGNTSHFASNGRALKKVRTTSLKPNASPSLAIALSSRSENHCSFWPSCNVVFAMSISAGCQNTY